MQLNNSFLSRSNILTIFYIFLFYVFVFPYSIGIDGQGISANYLFVFFPLIALLIKREIAWPPKSVFFFMAMLSLIFLVGSIAQVEHYDVILRRSASFLVFMSVFTFMFVRMDSDMIRAFKFAVVLWTFSETFVTTLEYISIDGNNLAHYAKGLLGSQRTGFIYLVGFWIIILFKTQNSALKIVKFLAAYVVLAGLFLTYSRSSILGLIGSSGVYFIYLVITSFKNSKSNTTFIKKVFSKLFYLIMLFALVVAFFPGPVDYYSSTIINPIISTEVRYAEIEYSEASNRITIASEKEEMDNIENIDNIDSITKSKELEISEQNLSKAEAFVNEKLYIENKMQILVFDRLKKLAYAKDQAMNIKRVEAIRSLYKDSYDKAEADRIYWKDGHTTTDAENTAIDAEQTRLQALDGGDPNEVVEAERIYKEYVEKNDITNKNFVDAQLEVKRAKAQLDLTLTEEYLIELKKLLFDTEKQLEIAKEQESIKKIKQKIYDINYQIASMKEKAVFFATLYDEESALKLRLEDQTSSIGYRAFMHKKVFAYTYQNPLTGSAFLGVWSLFENREGSAHSQYLDILFRVGVFAFIAYLLFLYKVTLFLYRKDLGLFFGFIGFLLVGTFHETIKLSQGAFIFSFFFAMWAQRQYLQKDNEKTY
jgi:hypothetical protein